MEARYRRVISADSHVREPVDLWSNALGKKFGERTPRLLHEHKGRQGRFFYTGLRGHDACRIGDIEAEQRDRIDDELARAGYDPAVRVKFQERAHIEAEVSRIINENANRPGHIFNLGHGILPNVDPEHAKYMVECVHRLSGKK